MFGVRRPPRAGRRSTGAAPATPTSARRVGEDVEEADRRSRREELTPPARAREANTSRPPRTRLPTPRRWASLIPSLQRAALGEAHALAHAHLPPQSRALHRGGALCMPGRGHRARRGPRAGPQRPTRGARSPVRLASCRGDLAGGTGTRPLAQPPSRSRRLLGVSWSVATVTQRRSRRARCAPRRAPPATLPHPRGRTDSPARLGRRSPEAGTVGRVVSARAAQPLGNGANPAGTHNGRGRGDGGCRSLAADCAAGSGTNRKSTAPGAGASTVGRRGISKQSIGGGGGRRAATKTLKRGNNHHKSAIATTARVARTLGHATAFREHRGSASERANSSPSLWGRDRREAPGKGPRASARHRDFGRCGYRSYERAPPPRSCRPSIPR